MTDPVSNLMNIRRGIEAMRSAGIKDDAIADRIAKRTDIPPEFKSVFAQAKSGGYAGKAVNDFMELPLQTPAYKSEDLKTQGVVGKLGELTGVEPLGRYLSAKLAMLNPEQRKNIQTIQSRGDTETAKQLSTGGVSKGELAGSAISTASQLALPFAGKALSTGKIGTRLLTSGLVQGGMSAAGAAAAGGSGEDVLRAGETGALLGASFPVAGAMFRGSRNLLNRLPEALYSKIFKAEGGDIAKLIESRIAREVENPSLAKEILNTGIKGSAEGMGYTFGKLRNEVGKELAPLAKASGKNFVVEQKYYKDILRSIANGYDESLVPDKAAQAKKLLGMVQKQGTKGLPADTILEMRQFIDQARAQSSFKMNPNLSMKQEAYKTAADKLRGKLHTIPELSDKLNEYRIYTQAFDDLVKEAVRERNRVLLSYLDGIGLAAGAAAGMPTVALGASATLRASRSPAVITNVAQGVKSGLDFFERSRKSLGGGNIGAEIRTAGRQIGRTLTKEFTK